MQSFINVFIYVFFFQDRESFSRMLEDTENWLYDEGEDQNKQVYLDKLADMKVGTKRIL